MVVAGGVVVTFSEPCASYVIHSACLPTRTVRVPTAYPYHRLRQLNARRVLHHCWGNFRYRRIPPRMNQAYLEDMVEEYKAVGLVTSLRRCSGP